MKLDIKYNEEVKKDRLQSNWKEYRLQVMEKTKQRKILLKLNQQLEEKIGLYLFDQEKMVSTRNVTACFQQQTKYWFIPYR